MVDAGLKDDVSSIPMVNLSKVEGKYEEDAASKGAVRTVPVLMVSELDPSLV